MNQFESYLKNLCKANPPLYDFIGCKDEQELKLMQRAGVVTLKNLLKITEIPSKSADLHPQETEPCQDCGWYLRKRITLTICEDLSFPMYLLIPKQKATEGRTPCAVFCHGHGIGSRVTIGIDAQGNALEHADYHHLAPIELCKLGYTVAVPEILGFGDVSTSWDQTCRATYGILAMQGLSLAGLRVYQIMRIVDYLILYHHADLEKMTCMGISGGGMLTTLVSAVDPRIQTAVISGYLSSFEQSIYSIEHCICNFVPDLGRYFEMDSLASLIAPRKLIMEAGTKDPIFPIEAVRKTYQSLQQVYHTLQADQNLFFEEFEGEHCISGKVAYEQLRLK